MEDSRVSDRMSIRSSKFDYTVEFTDGLPAILREGALDGTHFIVDRRVAELYAGPLKRILSGPSVVQVEAIEENKSLEALPGIVDHLVRHGLRRGQTLVAIGGGIIQDITCFLSATMLRGVPWEFVPTTLLAQTDSCIGSKSSINCAGAKNILGTFTPPRHVHLGTGFLDTLSSTEIHSGVGEILKAHAIDGPRSFDGVAADYPRLLTDRAVLLKHVRRALAIKKPFVEADEYDQNVRLVFNYGHSFGHALEAATEFGIPHGVAVSMGMDIANLVAVRLGVGASEHYRRMHAVLRDNYAEFATTPVPREKFFTALSKDKKNTGAGSVTLILPDKEGRIFRDTYAFDERIKAACSEFFSETLVA
jgi:3-dehydroquinate synthase